MEKTFLRRYADRRREHRQKTLGAIFAVADGRGRGMRGKVFWRDSLGMPAPPQHREAVKEFLRMLLGPKME